jgi:hypothetical protein
VTGWSEGVTGVDAVRRLVRGWRAAGWLTFGRPVRGWLGFAWLARGWFVRGWLAAERFTVERFAVERFTFGWLMNAFLDAARAEENPSTVVAAGDSRARVTATINPASRRPGGNKERLG